MKRAINIITGFSRLLIMIMVVKFQSDAPGGTPSGEPGDSKVFNYFSVKRAAINTMGFPGLTIAISAVPGD